MKFIEDKLEALDAYFSTKKESEKWLMIVGTAGIIAYIAYIYFLPYTETIYKKSESTKQRIEKSIIDNKSYLNSITVSGDRDFYVKKYDHDIKAKNENIVRIKKNVHFIDKNLEKLSDMLFNQTSWSRFLNSVTKKAELEHIDLHTITNKYVDSNGSFGHVLEISVACQGEYRNIVKFMNEIEQNTLVTDIYGSKLTLDQNSTDILADINISVWGINH